MSREIKNNQVILSGEIVSNFEFSHEAYGEEFYTAMLAIKRASTVKDIIPIMVSNRLIDTGADWERHFVRVSGQFRSHNKYDDCKRKLILSVFATEFEEWKDDGTIRPSDKNIIFLDGYICKPSEYRETPLGREITEILLAVNRPYEKTDYLPTICWSRNARFAGGLEVGTRLQVEGRIQSREYQKRISDNEYETRTVYEVSISKLTVVEEI